MFIIKVNDLYISDIEFNDYEINMNFTTNKNYAIRYDKDVIGYYISIVESFFYNSDVERQEVNCNE